MTATMCSVDGCDRPSRAKGMCSKHYQAARNARAKRQRTTAAAAAGAEFVAVFPDYGGVPRTRLCRQARDQLASMLGDDVALAGDDWMFEHVPATLPGEPAWLVARRPASSSRPDAEVRADAHAVTARIRGVLPGLAASLEARMSGEQVAA